MYNNTISDIISDLNLPIGHSKRMNCPICKGINTFSVTNNMGRLLWNCYKVSCTVSGKSKVKMSAEDIRNTFNEKKVTSNDFFLPDSCVKVRDKKIVLDFLHKWGLISFLNNLLFDVKESRLVFPVLHHNKIVDATGRALTSSLPKWKRYGNSGIPFSSGFGDVAVVVEDCVSASVVGTLGNFVGVAVLGTSLLPSHRDYLTQFSTAVIALDPDALPKTLSMAKELRGYVNKVLVLRLEDDLKYQNKTDIKNLIDIGEK
jgi:hypothetical protein